MANKYIQLKDNSGNQLYPRTDWSVILNIPAIPTVASVNAKQDALTSANAGTNITITTVNGVTKINAPDMSSYTSLSNKPSINGVTLSGALTAADLNLPWCVTTSNGDLEFADNSGNVILRLSNGHIRTKNFDSSEKILSLSQLTNDMGYITASYHDPSKVNSADLINLIKGAKFVQYSDASGFSILNGSGTAVISVQNGHISTANFDSSSAINRISNLETGKQAVLTSANAGSNVTITTESGVVKINATGGGGGGSSNYNDLTNRPYINGVLIAGSQAAYYYGLTKVATSAGATTFYNDSNAAFLSFAAGHVYNCPGTGSGSAATKYLISSDSNNNSSGQFAVFDGGASISASTLGVTDIEVLSNKVTSLSSDSTDTEYPSAKAVYDELQTRNNQNAFSTISAEYVSISATSATDSIEFIAGSNITLEADATNKTLTIDTLGPTVPSGGTTGQVLTKLSNSNYDFDWANSSGAADIYWVTYNSTSFTDIATAVYNGKIPVMLYNNKFYICCDADPSVILFQTFDSNRYYWISVSDSNSWTSGNDFFERTSYKVTSISSSSTDTQYPSAKLLYDQLLSKISEPATDGTSGQVLSTDGNGGRSWISVSGTSTSTIFDATLSGTSVTLSNSKTFNDVVTAYDDGANEVFIRVDNNKFRISSIRPGPVSTYYYINTDSIILSTMAYYQNCAFLYGTVSTSGNTLSYASIAIDKPVTTFSGTLSSTTVTLSGSTTLNDIYSAYSSGIAKVIYIVVDSNRFMVTKCTKSSSQITIDTAPVHNVSGTTHSLKAIYANAAAQTATTLTWYSKTL